MSLKVKLTSTIASFFLILGLVIMGVFAAPTATINLGGKITFTATDVNAEIRGTVTGTADATQPTLPTLSFKAGATEAELAKLEENEAKWGQCNLNFKSDGSEISILIEIENKADRILYASITDMYPAIGNVDKSLLQVESKTATQGNEMPGVIEIGGKDTAYVRIGLSIYNSNLSVDGTWGYDINLADDSALEEDAVGVMKINNSIALVNSLPADTYTLKYENEEGVLTDYADICSLESGESYNGLISQNMAPQTATKIGVYNSSDERIGSVGFTSTFKKNLGEKLYSFGAISDVHIGYNTAESDFQTALTYFGNDSSIEFIANCGDLATSGDDARLATYKSIVDQYAKTPVYAISGNHEASRGYLANDALMSYTGQNLYYSVTQGNDVYIMVGMYDVHAGEEFSLEELTWLNETLEANRNKRCFVFMHLNPRDGSGDAVDLDLEGDMLSNPKGEVFYSLMSHYTNVTWFHGHTHAKFNVQELNGMNTYDNVLGIHSVHIPSLTNPKYVNETNTAYEADYDASEGYVVDVYENHVVLRGRDFVNGKFLPIATYYLDTTLDTIEADTYYDDTQTIINNNSNILKENETWYESTMAKSEITKISFVESYDATSYDESWDASISGNNQVMAYRTGTEITIVGNENGIVANINSNNLFKDFSNLTEISGLENINTSNATDFQNVFTGCAKLTNIDISSLDLRKVQKFNGLFQNCSALTSFKLPNNMGESCDWVVLQESFSGCSSLIEVDLTNVLTLTEKSYFLTGLFRECSSLKKVKFGNIKVASIAIMFYKCNNIQEVDMKGVDVSRCDTMINTFRGCSSLSILKLPTTMDTSKVENFSGVFYGCSALTLDCSAWDTTSCTSYTDFNTGAPGVIPPSFS